MEIVNREIVNNLASEIIMSLIGTFGIIIFMLIIFSAITEYKEKRKRLLRIFIVLFIVSITPFTWYKCITRGLIPYERVTAIVKDWNEVYDGEWDIIERDKNKVILERRLSD